MLQRECRRIDLPKNALWNVLWMHIYTVAYWHLIAHCFMNSHSATCSYMKVFFLNGMFECLQINSQNNEHYNTQTDVPCLYCVV